MSSSCRLLLDEADDLRLWHPGRRSSRDECMDRVAQAREGGGVRADDDRAAAPSEVDQALVAQQLVGAKDGVEVDLQGACDFLGRRQPVADGQLALAQLSPHARGDLLEDWLPRQRVDPE